MASSIDAHKSEQEKPVEVQTLELIYKQCTSEVNEFISEYSEIGECIEEYAEVVSHGMKEISRIKNEYNSAYQKYSFKLAELDEGSKRCSLFGEHYRTHESLIKLRQMLRNELKQYVNRTSMYNHTSLSGLVSQKSVPQGRTITLTQCLRHSSVLISPLRAPLLTVITVYS